jgi:hypothetical protein
MWRSQSLIALILLKVWWDMRRLMLCCSIGLGSYLVHVRTHVTRHTSWWAAIDTCLFCWTWYQKKRGPCPSIPDEKSKIMAMPGGAVLSSFRIESQICPGLKSGTQRVPRHISTYCLQNSAYTDWFCPGGSVCSIPPFSRAIFQMAGVEKLKIWSFKNVDFRPPFFLKKSCLFLRTEMNDPPSNFTGNTV